jgi:hypothetical protein
MSKPWFFVEDVMKVYPLGKVIARGTYSAVYSLVGIPDRLLRVQRLTKSNTEMDIKKEIMITSRMVELKIAPLVLSNFFDASNHGMLIERYDMSLSTYLYDVIEVADKDAPRMWVMNVASLLKRLANDNILCTDVKPGNIVVNTLDNSDVKDVRLIDFGGDYCQSFMYNKSVSYTIMTLLMNAHIYTYHGYSDDLGPFSVELKKQLSKPSIFNAVSKVYSDQDQFPLAKVWNHYFKYLDLPTYMRRFVKPPTPPIWKP